MHSIKILLAIMLVFITNHANSGFAPIINLPDYNGTYWGAPGTGGNCDSRTSDCDSTAGRKMFSTLYRDNYNDTGCEGENCGSHAGVDITVASGTPVIASLPGKIIVAECRPSNVAGNGQTGGTVIIEADNPYISGKKVYLVYAHLNDWDLYAEGDIVKQGYIIGISGGDPNNDTCAGSSTGAHLHFQVDKNPPDANDRPWIPNVHANQSTNTADSNFIVSKNTYNPLPFVTGKAYNFTFSESKNSELWGVGNANSTGVSSGSLWIDGEGPNVYVGRTSYIGGNVACGESAKCSREITLDADVFKKMVLDIDFKCPAGKTMVYYRGPDDVWRSFTFDYTTAKKYTLTLSNLTYWKGIITDFMIKPSAGCTANSGSKEYFIKQMYFSK